MCELVCGFISQIRKEMGSVRRLSDNSPMSLTPT